MLTRLAEIQNAQTATQNNNQTQLLQIQASLAQIQASLAQNQASIAQNQALLTQSQAMINNVRIAAQNSKIPGDRYRVNYNPLQKTVSLSISSFSHPEISISCHREMGMDAPPGMV